MKLSNILTQVTDRPVLREFVRPIIVFLIFLLMAASGFSTLDGVGFIDGLFWVIDPGGITQYFRTNEGPETRVKAFAIFTLVMLVLTGLWMVETGLSAVFGGQIHTEIRDMKIKQHIDELSDHVIVCGYGTFGRTIVSQLRATGQDVVIIERDESHYDRIITNDLLAINGDARHKDVLTQAGVSRAATIVGAIDDAKTNIQIAVVASESNPTTQLVVRVGNEMDKTLAKRVGIDEVVIPEVVSGKEASNMIALDDQDELSK